MKEEKPPFEHLKGAERRVWIEKNAVQKMEWEQKVDITKPNQNKLRIKLVEVSSEILRLEKILKEFTKHLKEGFSIEAGHLEVKVGNNSGLKALKKEHDALVIRLNNGYDTNTTELFCFPNVVDERMKYYSSEGIHYPQHDRVMTVEEREKFITPMDSAKVEAEQNEQIENELKEDPPAVMQVAKDTEPGEVHGEEVQEEREDAAANEELKKPSPVANLLDDL